MPPSNHVISFFQPTAAICPLVPSVQAVSFELGSGKKNTYQRSLLNLLPKVVLSFSRLLLGCYWSCGHGLNITVRLNPHRHDYVGIVVVVAG